MTPDELAAAGQRIYGEHWVTPLAAALGVNVRVLRRWLSGRNPIPEFIEVNTRDLVDIAVYRGRPQGS